MCHYPDLGSASNWSCLMGNLLPSIRSTTQIWVVMCHQYRIFALKSQTSFVCEISGDFSLKPSEQRITRSEALSLHTIPQSPYLKVSLLLQRQIARKLGKTTAQECNLWLLFVNQKCPFLLFLGWNMEKGNKCPGPCKSLPSFDIEKCPECIV